ncbi:transposase [Candidatus Saccharibacteria bacterium]|nr:transposase [Candidatus Saccharibacteria bacterium]
MKQFKEGALVVTDAWWGYEKLEFYGDSHESWNHSLGRYAGTNPVEKVWSALKRYLRKLYGCVPTKYLDVILKEWEARHNFPELLKSPQNYLAMSLVPC